MFDKNLDNVKGPLALPGLNKFLIDVWYKRKKQYRPKRFSITEKPGTCYIKIKKV